MLMRKFTVAFYFILASLAHISTTAAQSRAYVVVNSGQGHQKVMATGAVSEKTCASLAQTIILRSKPTKGQVRFTELDAPFPAKLPHCAGKILHRTLIEYLPDAGANGFEQFYVLATGGPAPPSEHEIVIWIADPNRPNTAPPNRASVDQLLGPAKTFESWQAQQIVKTLERSTASAAPIVEPGRSEATGVTQTLSINVDASGHYRANVTIGGVSVPALFDTGATSIAISRSDLAKFKITLPADAPTVQVMTAAGRKEGRLITLTEMRVGTLIERAVPCVVLPPGVDSPMLIGMAFMSRLASVKMADGKMVLSK